MKKIFQPVFFVFLCCLLWSTAATANEKTYTVAIVPQFSSTQVYHDWTPILTKLQEFTGLKFELKIYGDFHRFESDFSKGVPDLVYLNPYHMLVAQKKQGYRPLIRDNTNLSGILVARQDSPIKEIAELKGKTIAFPAPNALGASLYIRALLAEKFKIKINPVYVKGHQNVYRQVMLGDVIAGGGIKSTFNKEPDTIQSQLKIIYTTPEIASHPLASHSRVTAAVNKKIIAAILAMANDPETAKLLSAVQIPKPVVANFKRDYADLAKLKLDRYAVIEE
jgi:phosphonate transport system substrate-binding protein